MQDLGTLDGASSSAALAVNGDGTVIVGRYPAFLWTPTLGMVDLQTYLISQGADLTGWTLAEARGVSADGRTIVGNGSNNVTGQSVWIARLRRCGSADFNHDGDSGTDADIEAFFACLAGNCCAACEPIDFNGDGDAGTDADIEAFFRVLAGGTC
jgi:hypothetical protein